MERDIKPIQSRLVTANALKKECIYIHRKFMYEIEKKIISCSPLFSVLLM